jgi:uncharacterized protein YajQ (UPF0234 family)
VAGSNSFDIVSKVDLQEVQNAVNNATREIAHRFDFKGAKAEIKLDEKTNKLQLSCDDAEKMKQLVDVLRQKMVARNVPLRAFTYGKVEPAGGRTVRQDVTMQSGIPSDKAKEIVKVIKNSKLKVQAAIQDDQVRVTGKSRDDLQEVMRLLKGQDLGIDMQFTNFKSS